MYMGMWIRIGLQMDTSMYHLIERMDVWFVAQDIGKDFITQENFARNLEVRTNGETARF